MAVKLNYECYRVLKLELGEDSPVWRDLKSEITESDLRTLTEKLLTRCTRIKKLEKVEGDWAGLSASSILIKKSDLDLSLMEEIFVS